MGPREACGEARRTLQRSILGGLANARGMPVRLFLFFFRKPCSELAG